MVQIKGQKNAFQYCTSHYLLEVYDLPKAVKEHATSGVRASFVQIHVSQWMTFLIEKFRLLMFTLTDDQIVYMTISTCDKWCLLVFRHLPVDNIRRGDPSELPETEAVNSILLESARCMKIATLLENGFLPTCGSWWNFLY